mgnify:CR=1 FL=1
MGYVARVSNPNNQDNPKVAGLLSYCIKHGHWSVFEQAHMTLEINTSRGIAAQILRHRSFTFQEFSQRYADTNLLTSEIPIPDLRSQDLKNRQNSVEVEDQLLQNEWFRAQQRVIYAAQREYEWAIANGIAKEQARAVLPEGLIESRLYMNGTLRSWIHFIELRSANGTQKEHQEVAVACAEVIAKIFPMASDLVAQL